MKIIELPERRHHMLMLSSVVIHIRLCTLKQRREQHQDPTEPKIIIQPLLMRMDIGCWSCKHRRMLNMLAIWPFGSMRRAMLIAGMVLQCFWTHILNKVGFHDTSAQDFFPFFNELKAVFWFSLHSLDHIHHCSCFYLPSFFMHLLMKWIKPPFYPNSCRCRSHGSHPPMEGDHRC